MSVVICVLIILAIFISFYMSKRRFGLFGLALAAGSILSGAWAYEAGSMVSALGVDLSPVVTAIISAVIIILPAYLLISHGHKNKTALGRLISSALFTGLAVAFLVVPLGSIFILQGTAVDIYNQMVGFRDLIIGAGLIVAVLDLFFTKSVKSSDKKHEH